MLDCIFFIAHAQNANMSTSSLKSDITIVLLDPDFLRDANTLAIHVHLRQQQAGLLIFA